jgi:LysR family transcriptional activator of nhaA
MDWLNYHHLYYFWLVTREGGLVQAAKKLRLAHPTVSAQVKALEESLGEKLFEKNGRRLVLTEMGRVVYDYAEEIFALGKDLVDTVKGRPTGRPLRLRVGIAEVVPKLIARQLLLPARRLETKVTILCREDKTVRLLSELGSHELDVVISDQPIPSGSLIKAYNHLLGECGVTLFARKELAARYRRGFPKSLNGAPLLLPSEGTELRRSLDQWFDETLILPKIEAEFDDSALMKVFGQDGAGVFPIPSAIEDKVREQYHVEVVGRVDDVRAHFYAISVERKIRHPAVAAICLSAREDLFAIASSN